LVIWRDRDDPVRDITLRPGLNVVWSPDAATDGTSIGHGGGKTTFCRLLRYCLGEGSFAPTAQRRATFDKMPNGRVGAEIRLAGQDWAVIRPFSSFHDDFAVPDASLADVLALTNPTGMEALRVAAAAALLGDAPGLMPKTIGESGAWSAVLAWLTRDQECRFGHLLDWRDKDSDSQSPIRARSAEDRLTVVRAVLGALKSEELAEEAKRDAKAESLRAARSDLGRLNWRVGEWRRELAQALGFDLNQPVSELDGLALARSANEMLTKTTGVATEATPVAVNAARKELDRLTDESRTAQRAVDRTNSSVEAKERTVRVLLDELPELSARGLTVLLCPVCHVPIDRARAEGCGISLQPCDVDTVQARFARTKETYEREIVEVQQLRQSLQSLNSRLATVEQRRNQQRRLVDRLLAVAMSRSATIRRAQSLLDDARRYGRLLSERDRAAADVEKAEAEVGRLGQLVASHRAEVSGLIQILSERCDLIARYLLPGEAAARMVLDGSGLHLHIEMGGDRTSAAIESLKVVIFDLAVMALSIEGRTRFPGFLVHDSPREADLDISVYHRLFGLARALEGFGPAPLFQYICTTTTTPPSEIAEGDSLRLTLRGAPPSERLFAVDL